MGFKMRCEFEQVAALFEGGQAVFAAASAGGVFADWFGGES
jgi:hypothetical protein